MHDLDSRKAPKMKYPLVRVYWHDAFNRGWWHTEEELDEMLEDESFMVQNVGWLVRDTKNFIIVAARISDRSDDPQYGLCEKLPRKMIEKIEVIEKEAKNETTRRHLHKPKSN